MYRIRAVQEVIGSGPYTIAVRAPMDRVPALERCRLRRAGFWDRFRNRSVADDKHTHFLHILQRQVRRMEGEVSKRVDDGITAIDLRAAELDAILAESMPAAEQPKLAAVRPAADLGDLRGRDRHEWASERREARRAAGDARAAHGSASAASAAHSARATAARVERAQLVVQRSGIIAEGESVRRLWREAFVVRGAVYSRARFGMFGSTPTDDPAVPDYAFAEGPTVKRD